MNQHLNFSYDREADVLYVSVGHLEYTDYEEVDDHFILRLDPDTKDVVGFTIIDFSRSFAQQQVPVAVPVKATFERILT